MVLGHQVIGRGVGRPHGRSRMPVGMVRRRPVNVDSLPAAHRYSNRMSNISISSQVGFGITAPSLSIDSMRCSVGTTIAEKS